MSTYLFRYAFLISSSPALGLTLNKSLCAQLMALPFGLESYDLLVLSAMSAAAQSDIDLQAAKMRR